MKVYRAIRSKARDGAGPARGRGAQWKARAAPLQIAARHLDAANKVWRAAYGMAVEDFGNADNLMIDGALIELGGHPMVRHTADLRELFRNLTGFETCLRLAAQAVAGSA